MMDERTREHLQDIKTVVDKWWAGEIGRVDRPAIEALRFELDLLEYLITERGTGDPKPAPQIGNPICSEPGCKAGWRDGLLNHAAAGFDPVWYCSQHLKQLEHTHHVPGSQHPVTPLKQKAAEMSRAWTRFAAVLETGEPALTPDRPSPVVAAEAAVAAELVSKEPSS